MHHETMTLSDLARWAGVALVVWAIAAIVTGCTRSTHVRAVNTAAAALETTAEAIRVEVERRIPGDVEARQLYRQRMSPVVDALTAAYAAHDAWRVLVEQGASESAVLAAAERAREAFCELASVTRELAPRVPTEGLCWQVAP
ncbi:MAG TPA: hypothetical protein VKY73_19610 [Polyangiaceae bacterium]|nr:hypothetical protein [Polyangiaceae bacterium]